MNMNSRTKIESFLKNWTNTKTSPKFGVLIEGNWGAGKTHFVKSILAKENFTDKKIIYLSLFGVKSIKDLETQLFFASANVAQKTLHRGASIASTLLKGTLRIDLDGDDESDGTIGAQFTGLNKFVEKISQDLNDALIIFDDLERCSIPMTDFLGFSNQFVEHGDTRILFVANSEKMKAKEKEKFDNFKEKVIGHRFELKAQPDKALVSFISDTDNKAVKELLVAQTSKIIELFHKSEYQNLRALRQFVWHYSELLGVINVDYRSNNYFLQNLTEQFFVFFTEFKLDLGRNGLAPENLVSGKNTIDNYTVYALHMNKEKEPSPKYRVLKKYSDGDPGYDCVIPVNAWVDILTSGVIEPNALNQHLSNSEYLKSSDPAWRQFMSFDKIDDEIVEQAKDELLDRFDNRKEHDIGTMLHMFALRFMMSEHGIIPDSIETVQKDCVSYIEELLLGEKLPARPTDWRWPESFKSEAGFGFAYWVEESYRDSFNDVQEHLNQARTRAFEKQGEQIADEILSALREDPEKFAKLISYWSGEGKYASVPVLQFIDTEKFVETWLNSPKKSWRTVKYSINSRYKHGGLQDGKNLEIERNWAIQLRKSLEALAAELHGYKRLRITRIIPNLPTAI